MNKFFYFTWVVGHNYEHNLVKQYTFLHQININV